MGSMHELLQIAEERLARARVTVAEKRHKERREALAAARRAYTLALAEEKEAAANVRRARNARIAVMGEIGDNPCDSRVRAREDTEPGPVCIVLPHGTDAEANSDAQASKRRKCCSDTPTTNEIKDGLNRILAYNQPKEGKMRGASSMARFIKYLLDNKNKLTAECVVKRFFKHPNVLVQNSRYLEIVKENGTAHYRLNSTAYEYLCLEENAHRVLMIKP